MVYFQCEGCVQMLKKKQIEPHFYQCKNSQHFSCLDCYKKFDRVTVKAHTSCITEVEKYQKGDNSGKKNNSAPANNNQKVIVPVNLDELKWRGFRTTSKKILRGFENYKLPMSDLFEKLAHVYAKQKGANKNEVDMELVKKHTLAKLENDDRFVLDLSKNTIRFKC